MDVIKHPAAAGHFVLACASRRLALFIIYAREWDGRPPQYEFIPNNSRTEQFRAQPASQTLWRGVSHWQPAVTIGWRTATAGSRLDDRTWQTSSSLISDQSSHVAASQGLADTWLLSQSWEHFSGTKLILLSHEPPPAIINIECKKSSW